MDAGTDDSLVDIYNTIFTERSADCSDYVNTYDATVVGIQNSLTFNADVTITATDTDTDTECTIVSNIVPNHDFGFSFILPELRLGEQRLAALLFFNLGVELGQMAVLLVVWPALWLLFRTFKSTLWAQALAVTIGLIGGYWLLERLLAL